MAPTSRQAQRLAEVKRRGDPLPFCDHSGKPAGVLRPVTAELAADDNLVEAMTRWRSDHRLSFLTVFTPTTASMRNYLNGISLADPGRALFLVTECEGKAVGNIGLCNVGESSAELDNVLRGEAACPPYIMNAAQNALLRWAFKELEVGLVYLNVLADNKRAIAAYERVGFQARRSTPLRREDFEGGYRLVPQDGSDSSRAGDLVRMEVSRADFELATTSRA